MDATQELPDLWPAEIEGPLLALFADAIERAAARGGRWGLTRFEDALRLNAGWTEILTATERVLRLIVDRTNLVAPAGALVDRGSDPRGYYPSVPGSVLVTLRLDAQLTRALELLRPTLWRAVDTAAGRGAGRGVKAGHSQQSVDELARRTGRSLPAPPYVQSELPGAVLMEGALERVLASRYERNAAARARCIAHYGARCVVCAFCFEDVFGEIGRGFIHVHHIEPLASTGGSREVDPIRDLRPVCPNCHAMIHAKEPPHGIAELRAILGRES